ncbi:MAG: phosphatase PAP2 family protein [Paludibacter sp.]|nr:phosphatase PAP2 family protein [Paludibacter sp.]
MKQNHSIHFLTAEKLTLFYIFISACVIAIIKPGLHTSLLLLGHRLMITLGILLLAFIGTKKNLKIIRFIRNLAMGSLLAFWYPETFDINKFETNRDYLLAGWEQKLFGFQPALIFSKHYPQNWICELMNMGYFSFYFIILGVGLYFYFRNRKYFDYFFFTVLGAFFVYYIIYIIFPTAGPQFYYAAIGYHNAASGVFPELGNFFGTHSLITGNYTNDHGIFFNLVETTQKVGERPTAAFPSSHVGISTLIMVLLLHAKQYRTFILFFPIYAILVIATVYIRAHYFVDVLAGFGTAVAFYAISIPAYKFFRTADTATMLVSNTEHTFRANM